MDSVVKGKEHSLCITENGQKRKKYIANKERKSVNNTCNKFKWPISRRDQRCLNSSLMQTGRLVTPPVLVPVEYPAWFFDVLGSFPALSKAFLVYHLFRFSLTAHRYAWKSLCFLWSFCPFCLSQFFTIISQCACMYARGMRKEKDRDIVVMHVMYLNVIWTLCLLCV